MNHFIGPRETHIYLYGNTTNSKLLVIASTLKHDHPTPNQRKKERLHKSTKSSHIHAPTCWSLPYTNPTHERMHKNEYIYIYAYGICIYLTHLNCFGRLHFPLNVWTASWHVEQAVVSNPRTAPWGPSLQTSNVEVLGLNCYTCDVFLLYSSIFGYLDRLQPSGWLPFP